MFGSRVSGGVGVGYLGDDGGDIDDPPPLRGDHLRKKYLAAIVCAGEIDSQHLLPETIRHLQKTRRRRHSRIVDQDLDCAKLICNLAFKGFYVLLVGYITSEGKGFASQAMDFFRYCIEGCLGATGDHHVAPLSGEGEGDGATDTAAASCNQDDFSSQSLILAHSSSAPFCAAGAATRFNLSEYSFSCFSTRPLTDEAG